MEKILYLRSDKTVLRRDDKIVKIFSGSYSKADVLNEALNQARAEETNLNVPTVYEVTKADGKWAIVSQYIEGKTLRAMMEENPEKREEYLDYFIGLQMAIHAEKCPLLIRMRDKLRRKIAHAVRSDRPAGAHAYALQSLPRRFQSLQRDHNGGGKALHRRLGLCDAGMRFRGRGVFLSAVLPVGR